MNLIQIKTTKLSDEHAKKNFKSLRTHAYIFTRHPNK